MKTRLTPRRFAAPSIEILETRVAPAGLVTANFAGGVLTLTGDTAGNEISIAGLGQDGYTLTGTSGTTISLNGAAAVADVTLEGLLGSIKADLGLGDDVLALNVVVMTGSVSVDAGDGNNTLSIANSSIGGSVTFLGGGNTDTVSASGTLFHVGGAISVNLGEGTNVFVNGATGASVGGLITVVGGTGVDNVNLSALSFVAPKGLKVNLGEGDNVFSLTAQDVRTGAISVSHGNHAGTAATTINASGQLLVSGGITVSYGTGNSTTTVGGTSSLEVSGALKVTASSGNDAVNIVSPGQGAIKGGVNLSLGDGVNVAGLGGLGFTLGSVTVNGGSGDDAFFANVANLRTGAINLNLGGGDNNVTFSGGAFRTSGALKLTGGDGEDNLSLTHSETRIPGGILFAAGDGVNVFSAGGASLQSGSVKVQYGDHAAGTSVVTIGNSITSLKSLTVTGKSGAETVAVGAGVAFEAGAVNFSLGDGDNNGTVFGPSVRLGGVSFTGGNGQDTITLGGQEMVVGGLKAFLGGGNNALSTTGSSLAVGGKVQITAESGDDIVTMTHLNQRYGAGLGLNLGDGANIGGFTSQAFRSGGGVKFLSGNHVAGTSSLNITAAALDIAGPVSATFGDGANGVVLVSQGTGRLPAVQYTGGSGSDTIQVAGLTAGFAVGSINFNGGDGDNATLINLIGGKVGAVKYAGGDGMDNLTISPALSRTGAITANFGSGIYNMQLAGTGLSRIGGAVNVQADNTAAQTGTLMISNITVAGPVTLNTGDGDETIIVSDAFFGGAFKASTLGGVDTFNIETSSGAVPTIFRGPVILSLGAGADVLNIGFNTAAGHAEFRSLARFDGGADSDTAHISTANFANIYIAGQPDVLGFETED